MLQTLRNVGGASGRTLRMLGQDCVGDGQQFVVAVVEKFIEAIVDRIVNAMAEGFARSRS